MVLLKPGASFLHKTMMKCRYTGDIELTQLQCLLPAAEMWKLESGGKTNSTSFIRGKSVGEHCFTSDLLDTFLCNPADMMISMKINRVGCSLVLVSSSCRLSYHSCATSVSAVWSASSLASVLDQASCSLPSVL